MYIIINGKVIEFVIEKLMSRQSSILIVSTGYLCLYILAIYVVEQKKTACLV